MMMIIIIIITIITEAKKRRGITLHWLKPCSPGTLTGMAKRKDSVVWQSEHILPKRAQSRVYHLKIPAW